MDFKHERSLNTRELLCCMNDYTLTLVFLTISEVQRRHCNPLLGSISQTHATFLGSPSLSSHLSLNLHSILVQCRDFHLGILVCLEMFTAGNTDDKDHGLESTSFPLDQMSVIYDMEDIMNGLVGSYSNGGAIDHQNDTEEDEDLLKIVAFDNDARQVPNQWRFTTQ